MSLRGRLLNYEGGDDMDPLLKLTILGKDGKRIPSTEYPQKAAAYLAEQQRKCQSDILPRSKNNPQTFRQEHNEVNDGPFTMEELNKIIAKQNNNKTPGSDQLRAEFVKYLDHDCRVALLNGINKVHASGILEPNMHEAIVVSIYKKGDSSLLENYQPISLLQAFYKVIAALIKTRLTEGLDDWISETQYGSRASRSTSHAIFLARRLQDLAEKSGNSIVIIMLDWEKAFDEINHGRLLEALTRIGVPDRIFSMIQNIYTNPKFKVRNTEGESDLMIQNAGIRQGCPLSPYPFILVMSVLFRDRKHELNTPKQQEPIPGIFFSRVLHADNTLIFRNHIASINKLL